MCPCLTLLCARWWALGSLARRSGFQDVHSGIKSFSYGIGTTSDPAENSVLSLRSVGQFTHHLQEQVLSMSHGDTVFVTLVAENWAGVTVTAVSAGVVIDQTPAAPPTDVTCSVDDDPLGGKMVTSTWGHAVDPESPLSHYLFGIGTSEGAAQVTAFVWRPADTTSAEMSERGLTDGQTYFCTVQAVNEAGRVSRAVSPGVLFDSTPPELGGSVADVVAGTNGDADYQTTTTTLSATWARGADGFRDYDTGVRAVCVSGGGGVNQGVGGVAPHADALVRVVAAPADRQVRVRHRHGCQPRVGPCVH